MSATPENCFHLTVEIVREIHQSAIRDFGGSDGIRGKRSVGVGCGRSSSDLRREIDLRVPDGARGSVSILYLPKPSLSRREQENSIGRLLSFPTSERTRNKTGRAGVGTACSGCGRESDRPRGDDEEIREGAGLVP